MYEDKHIVKSIIKCRRCQKKYKQISRPKKTSEFSYDVCPYCGNTRRYNTVCEYINARKED